jgi:hypothetical protein
MSDVLSARLKRAAEEKAPMLIIYHGGSQPGAKRWVVPLAILDNQLRARDVATDRAKMFSLTKIEIVEDPDAEPDYVEKAPVKGSLAEAIKKHLPEIASLGWRLAVTDKSVELFEPGNDKAVIGIRSNFTTAIVISVGGSSAEEKRGDGWRVFGPGFAAQIVDPEPDDDLAFAYKRLGAAISAFIREARQYAPRKQRAI